MNTQRFWPSKARAFTVYEPLGGINGTGMLPTTDPSAGSIFWIWLEAVEDVPTHR